MTGFIQLPTMAGHSVLVDALAVDAIEDATAPGQSTEGTRVAVNGLWIWVALPAADVLAKVLDERDTA